MQDNTPDNVELMVQNSCAFWVKRVLLSGSVPTKRITLNILQDIHNRLVSLFRNLDICYNDHRNICVWNLFKDALHLLKSGKKILAKNFVLNLKFFVKRTQTHCTDLKDNLANYKDIMTSHFWKLIPENFDDDVYNYGYLDDPCDI